MALYGLAVKTTTKGLRRIGFAQSPFQALLSAQASDHTGASLTSTLVICYEREVGWLYEVDLCQVLRSFGLRITQTYGELFPELPDELRHQIADAVGAFQEYLIGFDTMQTYPGISSRIYENLNAWVKPHDGTSSAPRFGNIARLFREALDERLEPQVQAAQTARNLYNLGLPSQGEMILRELILAQYPELEEKLP